MNKLFIGLFVCLLFVSVASADLVQTFDTSYIKWTMCDTMNLTKWSCDSWWQSDTNPYYLRAETTNLTKLNENFYNKTQVDEKINYLNDSNNFNNSDFYNRTEIDEKIKTEIKEFLSNRTTDFVTKDEFYEEDYTKGSSKSMSDSTLVFILIALVVGGIAFFYFTSKKSQIPDYDGNFGRVGQRKLHTVAQRKKDASMKKSNQLNEKPTENVVIDEDEFDN